MTHFSAFGWQLPDYPRHLFLVPRWPQLRVPDRSSPKICGLGSWSPRSVTQQLFDFDRKSARSFYVGGPSVPRPVLRRLDRFRASARDHTIVCVAILTIEPNRDYAIKEFGVILDKASDVKKRDTPV